MVKKLLIFILLSFLGTGVYSQTQSDSAKNAAKIYRVIKNDGSTYIGKIVSQDAREVIVDTKELGQVAIPKHELREISEVNASEVSSNGSFIPNEVFSTRYFITTNGLPIQKGENYIQWNLFGPDFQFGVAKNFGLGIMTTWLGFPIIGTAKYSIRLADKVNLGIGTLVGTGSWIRPDFGIALPFAALTFGDRRANINFSGGYGAVSNYGSSEGRALASVAGMAKVGKKVSLVFDSFIVLPGASRTSGFALIIPGIRWQMEPDKAFQFGFTGLYVSNDLVPVPIPTVQWYRKL